MRKLIILLIGIGFCWGQNPTSFHKEKGQLLLLPNLQYSPETSLGLGAALFYTKKWQNNPNNRSSIQKFYPIYTLKKQFSVGGSTDNWLNNNKIHLYCYARISYYPNDFYNFNEQTLESKESYTSRFFESESYFEYQLFSNMFFGIRADFKKEKILSLNEGKMLASGIFLGTEPYFATGVGPQISYDTRDNIYYPLHGFFITTRWLHFNKLLSNTTPFNRWDIDLRQYIRLSRRNDVLAYNLLYSKVDRQDIPFQMLPRVGGSKIHRGYFEGRYRGSQMIVAQVDYRFPISSRFKGIVFTNVGNASSQKNMLFKQKPHWAVGAGLRYRIGKEGLHIRLDIAYGQKIFPYIDVLEAF